MKADRLVIGKCGTCGGDVSIQERKRYGVLGGSWWVASAECEACGSVPAALQMVERRKSQRAEKEDR